MEWHRNSCETESITEEMFCFLSATKNEFRINFQMKINNGYE